jgi:ribosomal protein S27AE
MLLVLLLLLLVYTCSCKRFIANSAHSAYMHTAAALQLPLLPLTLNLLPLHTTTAATSAALLHRRGEEAYKTVLDKRQCPQCTAVQSYDEVKEKRKLCPNCNVEYQRPRVWAAVRKRFLQRLHEFERSRGQQRAAGEAALRHQVQQLALYMYYMYTCAV